MCKISGVELISFLHEMSDNYQCLLDNIPFFSASRLAEYYAGAKSYHTLRGVSQESRGGTQESKAIDRSNSR
jgi:hypothetical protein